MMKQKKIAKLNDGGSSLRLNDGPDVNALIMGWYLMLGSTMVQLDFSLGLIICSEIKEETIAINHDLVYNQTC